jgi:hypothetical protein
VLEERVATHNEIRPLPAVEHKADVRDALLLKLIRIQVLWSTGAGMPIDLPG